MNINNIKIMIETNVIRIMLKTLLSIDHIIDHIMYIYIYKLLFYLLNSLL